MGKVRPWLYVVKYSIGQQASVFTTLPDLRRQVVSGLPLVNIY